MFLKLDWGIIWPIVNIFVFYLLLRKFLFGPVSEIMEKRRKIISKDLQDAAAVKAAAKELKLEYQKSMQKAKDDAGQIVLNAREKAAAEYQMKIKQADEDIAYMKENARKDIEVQKQQVMADVKAEIAGIAFMAAAKVVEKEADSQTDKKLLEDFLKEAGV